MRALVFILLLLLPGASPVAQDVQDFSGITVTEVDGVRVLQYLEVGNEDGGTILVTLFPTMNPGEFLAHREWSGPGILRPAPTAEDPRPTPIPPTQEQIRAAAEEVREKFRNPDVDQIRDRMSEILGER